MKYLIGLFMLVLVGCASSKTAVEENTLIVTRKYVGVFREYRIVEGPRILEPETYWIKTNLDSLYGKIHIYTRKELALIVGDRLYIRRTHFNHPGINNTVYYLESSDGTVTYPLYPRTRSVQVQQLIIALFGTQY